MGVVVCVMSVERNFMPINVTRSSMPPFEEYCEEIRKFWDSHWLTNMGAEHQELERQLKEYLGTPELVLFTNGHLALENVIAAFQFPKGSEVITTPFTFVSTTHAIVRNGLKPVFCDVKPADYTIDVTKLEQRITEKTVAIVPVHVYGNLCRVEEIDRIARKHGLKVIYDAAHAFAETKDGVSTALFGDASMFSFHATKVFNTIEGGAVATRDPQLAEVLNDMKNFGIRNPESCVFVGGNAKMNEFQAAMGVCNLRHLGCEIEKRRRVYERYQERLANVPDLILPKVQEGVKSNYTYYPVIFKNSADDALPAAGREASELACGAAREVIQTEKTVAVSAGKSAMVPAEKTGTSPESEKKECFRRDRVYEVLKENGIIARKYFYPLTSAFECYQGSVPDPATDTPVAWWLSRRVLTLPLYADLEPWAVDQIVRLIEAC